MSITLKAQGSKQARGTENLDISHDGQVFIVFVVGRDISVLSGCHAWSRP